MTTHDRFFLLHDEVHKQKMAPFKGKLSIAEKLSFKCLLCFTCQIKLYYMVSHNTSMKKYVKAILHWKQARSYDTCIMFYETLYYMTTVSNPVYLCTSIGHEISDMSMVG